MKVGLEQLVEPALQHLRGLFPRQCASCGATFATYFDYLCTTAGGGNTCFDEFARLSRDEIVGTVGFAHCHCGSTLAVSSESAPVEAYRAFVGFLQDRAAAEKSSVAELLDLLMEMVRERELADHRPPP